MRAQTTFNKSVDVHTEDQSRQYWAVVRAKIALNDPGYSTDEQRLAALWSIVEPFKERFRLASDIDGQPFVKIVSHG